MNKSSYLFSSMLGNRYPFFLNNEDLSKSHYLYELVSPGLSEDLVPYVSLTKVSERTVKDEHPYGSDLDLVSHITGNKRVSEGLAAKVFTEVLKWEDGVVVTKGSHGKLPSVEMINDSVIQKSLVINLRDMLRWKTYKFSPGQFVDILVSGSHFLVAEFKGDSEVLWLSPVGIYNNSDVSLQTPLKINISERVKEPLEELFKARFAGPTKASEINKAIKKVERSVMYNTSKKKQKSKK